MSDWLSIVLLALWTALIYPAHQSQGSCSTRGAGPPLAETRLKRLSGPRDAMPYKEHDDRTDNGRDYARALTRPVQVGQATENRSNHTTENPQPSREKETLGIVG